jgi:hypothetical protein
MRVIAFSSGRRRDLATARKQHCPLLETAPPLITSMALQLHPMGSLAPGEQNAAES